MDPVPRPRTGRPPIVAVVGRPNVGKSTLVNRVLGRREAVVEERPGVTRDRKEFEAEWTGHPFILVDTGGWVVSPQERLAADIREQAEAALAGADAVLLVVDSQTGITQDDAGVADMLRRSGLPVILVANKVDDALREPDAAELWSLGLGEPSAVSALHGRGIGELLDRLLGELPEAPADPEHREGPPTLAIIGRPNVGKSTLLNRLAGSGRVLVSPSPGTTRDPIDVTVPVGGHPFVLVDTAGIRRASRVDDTTEYYSVIRARQALARADVAVLMVDASEGVTHQDQGLAEEVVEAGAGLVVLLNKWDALDEEQRFITERSVVERLSFVGWAPALRVSALTGLRVERLGEAAILAVENRRRRIPTAELNRLVGSWQDSHPPPVRRGRRPRILYTVQAGVEPPTVVLFVAGGDLGPDYLRYLENRLREAEDFTGTPIRLVTRARSRRPARV